MAGEGVKGARPVHAAPLSTSVLRPGAAANSPEAQNKGLAEGVLYSTTNLALTSTKGLSNSGNHSEAASQPPKYMSKTTNLPGVRAGPAAGRRSHLRSTGEIEV
jgi:hypothetical protein